LSSYLFAQLFKSWPPEATINKTILRWVIVWEDMIDEYRKCSDICALTDCSDKKSVRIHNKTVSQMYEIVKIASLKGPGYIEILAVLLDEKNLQNGSLISF
jgi:hypothetical protein